MRLGRIALFSVLIAVFAGAAIAQSAAIPPKSKPAVTSATEDISGMYSFEHDGEFVQVTIEPQTPEDSGKPVPVSGFISRYGDSDSDRGVFLDHFFSKGTLDKKSLSFSTKTVHSISYEFSGIVERGDGKSRANEGYFILTGTLKQNTIGSDKKTTSRSREITMKSFPDLDEAEAKP
jgi:hypothetical protein